MAHKNVLILSEFKKPVKSILDNFASDCMISDKSDNRFFLEDVTDKYMEDFLNEYCYTLYVNEECYIFPWQMVPKYYHIPEPTSPTYKKFFKQNKDCLEKFLPENNIRTYSIAPEFLIDNDFTLYKKNPNTDGIIHKCKISNLISFDNWFLKKYEFETKKVSSLNELIDNDEIKNLTSGEFYLIKNDKLKMSSVFILKAQNKFDYYDSPEKITASKYKKILSDYSKGFEMQRDIVMSNISNFRCKDYKPLRWFLKSGKFFNMREAEMNYHYQPCYKNFKDYCLKNVDEIYLRVPFQSWINKDESYKDTLKYYAFPNIDAIILSKYFLRNNKYLLKNNFERFVVNYIKKNDTTYYENFEYFWIEKDDLITKEMIDVFSKEECDREWRRLVHVLIKEVGETFTNAWTVNVHI